MRTLNFHDSNVSKIKPYSGPVKPGTRVDMLGVIIRREFESLNQQNKLKYDGSSIDHGSLLMPDPGDNNNCEFFLEVSDWVSAVSAAEQKLIAVNLGANFGYILSSIDAVRRHIAPHLDYLYVTVDPIVDHLDSSELHLSDNGIDLNKVWFLNKVVSKGLEPMLFPVGESFSGNQNAISVNDFSTKSYLLNYFKSKGVNSKDFENFLVNYELCGLYEDASKSHLKILSTITLAEIIKPLPHIDILESDLQQSEEYIFDDCMDLILRRVKLVHIATHGISAHKKIQDLFGSSNWDVISDFPPDSEFNMDGRSFNTNDGIFTARNMLLA